MVRDNEQMKSFRRGGGFITPLLNVQDFLVLTYIRLRHTEDYVEKVYTC